MDWQTFTLALLSLRGLRYEYMCRYSGGLRREYCLDIEGDLEIVDIEDLDVSACIDIEEVSEWVIFVDIEKDSEMGICVNRDKSIQIKCTIIQL